MDALIALLAVSWILAPVIPALIVFLTGFVLALSILVCASIGAVIGIVIVAGVEAIVAGFRPKRARIRQVRHGWSKRPGPSDF